MDLLHVSLALLLLAPTGECKGWQRKNFGTPLLWPKTGLEQCKKLVDQEMRQNCSQCFTGAGNKFIQIKSCVHKWLPTALAMCTQGNQGLARPNFDWCVRRKRKSQISVNRRADVLYKVGGAALKILVESTILEDGPAAIMSCMAQELLLSSKIIKDSVKNLLHDCFERFKTDPQNAQWHISKSTNKVKKNRGEKRDEAEILSPDHTVERNMVYQYGAMGHDMPFNGVGPLAVDILKGECLLNYLKYIGKLQGFVDAALATQASMPAWIFQELVKNITSITLP